MRGNQRKRKSKNQQSKSRVSVETQKEALARLRASLQSVFGVLSSSDDEDQMYFITKVPDLRVMPRLTINTPEIAKALIEDLITHRRNV